MTLSAAIEIAFENSCNKNIMTIHFLDIPDDVASLRRWLEDRLNSDSLGEVVAELSAFHPADAPRGGTIESFLGSRLNDVLSRGLSALPESNLRELIRHPWLLLDLQERIFIEGSSYWTDRPPALKDEKTLDRVWTRVSSGITSGRATGRVAPTKKAWIGLLTLVAATVVCGLFLRGQFSKPATRLAALKPSCGWILPDGLKQDVSREAYFQLLAAGADDWFEIRPSNSSELATAITQFLEGCSKITASENQPLPPADKTWLLERCQAWSKKLDEHLADLKAGADFREVKSAADATIKSLVEKLQERGTVAS